MAGPHALLIEGNNSEIIGNGTFRLMSTFTKTIISDLTFKNGSVCCGGAIGFGSASLNTSVLIGCHFESNHASSFGGALLMGSSSGYHELVDCEFIDNSSNGIGGAISYAGKGLKITNVVFQNNSNSTQGTAIDVQNNDLVLCGSFIASPDQDISYTSGAEVILDKSFDCSLGNVLCIEEH